LGDCEHVTGEMKSQVTDVASVSEVCSKHSYLPLRHTAGSHHPIERADFCDCKPHGRSELTK
jgi:hypothetical protein